MIRFLCAALLLLSLLASCTTEKTENLQPNLPVEVKELVDTLNRGNLGDSDTALAMKMVQDMLIRYPYSRDSFTHAILVQQLARNYLIRDQRDSLVKYASEGLRYFESVPYYNKWKLIDHYRLAIASYENGDIGTAVWHANKARLEAEHPQTDSLLPPRVKAQYLADLAVTCRVATYYEEAQTCITSALKYASRLPPEDISILNNCMLEAAALKTEMMQPDSSYQYLKVVRESSASHPDERNEMILNTRLADYFASGKQWDSMLLYQMKLIQAAKVNSWEDQDLGNTFVKMGQGYFYTHRMKEAGVWFNKATSAFQHAPSSYNLRDSNLLYSALIPYYIKTGDTAAAMKAYAIHLSLSGRFLDDKHIRQVKVLETQYRLRDKEAAITGLRADGLEYQLALRNKNTWLWGSIIGAVVAILIMLWITSLQRQQRLKAESRELLESRSKTELEQRLLRTQMEPHFIFNSLSVLQSYMREGNTEKSLYYLNRFAKLLRVSLEHSRTPFVLLKNELDALENYLQLQQMRFENLFEYHMDIYEGYEDDNLKLPPMLLQPFVENTIHHGFRGIRYQGIIRITISKKGEALHVFIDDNGVGLQDNHEPSDKSSVSTHIIRERLNILSRDTGIRSDLKMTSKILPGTLVFMAIPIVKG